MLTCSLRARPAALCWEKQSSWFLVFGIIARILTKYFPTDERFGLTSQMRRAAVEYHLISPKAVVANIPAIPFSFWSSRAACFMN